jgi:hypothetical protein
VLEINALVTRFSRLVQSEQTVPTGRTGVCAAVISRAINAIGTERNHHRLDRVEPHIAADDATVARLHFVETASPMSNTLYDTDFYAWTAAQARLLREGRADAADLAHLAEEIESVGRNERREVRNRMARLCQHLLKWTYQPEHRSRSWHSTIATQRTELAAVLEDSPSLEPFTAEVLPVAYMAGRRMAEAEAGFLALPEACPWRAAEVLDEAFWPD